MEVTDRNIKIRTHLGQLPHAIAHHPEIKTAALFGSGAKGTQRPGSDIDLAISFENPVSFSQWLDLQIQMDELDLP